ncbi:uncharacterized protein E5676_scaffold447G001400 [Cucumis melo var. makuwa]|uniref:Asp_protease_2 domain-containing protein n=1 Tax=Cucumis melo var. makuwa TaxID=1194695 RepID=A0A5D3CEK5_CUCMM|nr:uncharacterized protein E6C27_scaffold320G00870 [Cucumis melo var. makuwa]TYK09722.1 uncharacterized protein E5676_scaffold447G001400 [Cucumis melo var. makuwa]
MVDSGATYNFITEVKARRLRLRWEKDSEKMKAVNFVALLIVELVKQTMMKLGGRKGPVDFVVVKMDDFDVVLGMKFLLKHQPNRFKMISAMQLDKSPIREEPTPVAILLEALRKSGETVPKDTLCVLEKCHGMMQNSWPKSLPSQRMIDHEIELLPEANSPAKNVYRTTPPKLAELLKELKELLNTGFDRLVQASFAKEWGQMTDIAEAGLEKASRQMEKRADQKQYPLSFEWRIKFPISSATMPYKYLLT